MAKITFIRNYKKNSKNLDVQIQTHSIVANYFFSHFVKGFFNRIDSEFFIDLSISLKDGKFALNYAKTENRRFLDKEKSDQVFNIFPIYISPRAMSENFLEFFDFLIFFQH